MADPVVSILFPTIRPGQFRRSFDSLHDAADGLSYEVIVVADFPRMAADENCVWITSKREGPVNANERAHKAALGKYLFMFNDESTLDPGALTALYREAAKEPWAIFTPRHVPAFNFAYYGLPFAPFPFIHVGVVARLGGLVDTAYGGFYADPDLSMRAHAGNVPVRVVDDAVIRHSNNSYAIGHQENLVSYYVKDQRLFRSRWDHLGEFRDP